MKKYILCVVISLGLSSIALADNVVCSYPAGVETFKNVEIRVTPSGNFLLQTTDHGVIMVGSTNCIAYTVDTRIKSK